MASPVLANFALDGLERRIREKYPQATYWRHQAKVNVFRYADDFIITGVSQEVLEQEVKPLVTEFMRERGVELSETKTAITPIEDGFDFLGQNVRKYDGKLLIKPSKQNLQTFLGNIRKVIKANKQTTAYKLITLLNPKAIVFYMAFFPLFVDPARPAGIATFAVMAATIAALTFLYGLVVTVLTHRLAERLRAEPRIGRLFARAAGVFMIGFGLKLALSR